MADASDYHEQWEGIYQQSYAAGHQHWRPELATPPAFLEFLQSPWAPPKNSRILEAGCGDGLNAIFLTRLGYRVTGVDVSESAIARAREAATEENVAVEFLCLDLVRDPLPEPNAFDLWVDIKTLHCLWNDAHRQAYLSAAARALRPNGILFLNCGLALSDVRTHFPEVFAVLDLATQAWADTLDRDLPPDQRQGIRCETLDWYCREIEQAGFAIREARREADPKTGWGAIIIAQKMS